MSSSGAPRRHRIAAAVGSVAAFLLIGAAEHVAPGIQSTRPARREFTVVARDYQFSPAQLSVQQSDIVRVVFRAEDIAHSFVIDEYRIAKRSGAGDTVEFEFRAHRPGRFPFYCNLTFDERCSQMLGELVVSP